MISTPIFDKVTAFILPILGSIPTLLFISNRFFPLLEKLNVQVSSDGAFLILISLPFLVLLFSFSIWILFPCLIYKFFKSLKNQTALSHNFWLMNRFFSLIMLLLFLFVVLFAFNTHIPGIPTREDTWSTLLYGCLLFLMGLGCSTHRVKRKWLWLLPLFIFVTYQLFNAFHHPYHRDEIMVYWIFHLVFFAEIFLFQQLLNKPYLRPERKQK